MTPRKPGRKPKKHPGGRPLTFNPRVVYPVTSAMLRAGSTVVEVAAQLGVNLSTIYDWRAKYPEFSEILQNSRLEADSAVREAMWKRATGYDVTLTEVTQDATGKRSTKLIKKHIPGDSTAQIFWLKNRCPREFRDRHEVTGADGGPIQVETIVTNMEQCGREFEQFARQRRMGSEVLPINGN